MGTRGKINAIWWNIKINLQKLVDVCRYELRNISPKTLNRSENIRKSFFLGGVLFLKHPVHDFADAVINRYQVTVNLSITVGVITIAFSHTVCTMFRKKHPPLTIFIHPRLVEETLEDKKLSCCWDSARCDKISDTGRSANSNSNHLQV